MIRPLSKVVGSVLFVLGLSACAGTGAAQPPAPDAAEARADGACDAKSLSWTIGQVADDALVERARVEAGAKTVRVIRPGMMITNDSDASRLNLRIDVERKVLAYNCG